MDLKEEVRDGYSVSTNRKKLWKIELEMLQEFDRVCQKYEIDWFLTGGSAIGAVRHKGFIPWDDDIDIGMKRDDFEKFISVAQDELDEKFALQYGLSETSFHYFCRIRDKRSTGIIDYEATRKDNSVKGVFIELYPFDHVPSSKLMKGIQWRISWLLIELIQRRVYHKAGSWKCEILAPILKKVPTQTLFTAWKHICTVYNTKQTNYVDTVSIPGYSASEVDLFYAEDIAHTEWVPFEDTVARIAIGNDRCLKRAYGDYLQLPPIEERGTHHNRVVFYDPQRSYTEYEGLDTVKRFFLGEIEGLL